MTGFAVVLMAVLVTVKLMAMPVESASVVSCDYMQTSLSPCFEYLVGWGNVEPEGMCCTNVWSLIGKSQPEEDREAMCNCIKPIVASLDVKPDAGRNLSFKCGVPIGYSISPNVDCSKYFTFDHKY